MAGQSEIKSSGPLATAALSLPENLKQFPCTVFLKYQGVILATGTANPGHQDGAEIALQSAFQGACLPHANCEFWAVCHTTHFRGPYAAFGDHYHIELALTATRQPKLYLPASVSWHIRDLSDEANLLTVHYHNFAGNYDNIGLWTWDAYQQRMPRQLEVFPSGYDDYGLIFQIDTARYGVPTNPLRIGMAPRLRGDWSHKDGEDRFWTPAMGDSIYLLAGRSEIFSEQPMTQPHLTDAHIDTRNILHLDLSHPITKDEVRPESFHLKQSDGRSIAIAQVKLLFAGKGESSTVIELVTESALDVEFGSFSIAMDGYGPSIPALPREILEDPNYFLDAGARLGARVDDSGTVFRVFAPTATAVQVILYESSNGSDGRRELPMQRSGKGVWTTTTPDNLEGTYYNYLISGSGFPQGGETTDIYTVNAVDSSRRARITRSDPQLGRVNNGDFFNSPDCSPVDAIIWEVHIRDFSISENSGLHHRGKYMAFTEDNAHLPGFPDISTGVDHIAELGVTHVQLLPVHDYEGDELNYHYNWGYMTNLFNTPEGAYASNPLDDSRVLELKALINALHRRGIGVILDVVYNHTGTAAPFNLHVPRYYYRHNPDGSYSNGSGTGNEFRSESPMGRKYILDTLLHWVTEYDVDGFRFDLMALIDIETMRTAEHELRKLKPNIMLYGEPWQAAASPLNNPTDKHSISNTGIAAFNDDFRNAVKGDPNGPAKGFIQDGSNRFNVEHTMAASHQYWAASPAHTVNYLTCHDNLALYDKLKLSCPDADENLLEAMARLGFFILLTAQGIPFIHAGSEFLRTKFGDHNSYQSPDSVNQIDWSLKQSHNSLFQYVKKLIALRKAHPVFRLRCVTEVTKRVKFHFTPTGDTILCMLDGRQLEGEVWQSLALVLNASDTESHTINLPGQNWHIVFDHHGNPGDSMVDSSINVPPKSAMILCAK